MKKILFICTFITISMIVNAQNQSEARLMQLRQAINAEQQPRQVQFQQPQPMQQTSAYNVPSATCYYLDQNNQMVRMMGARVNGVINPQSASRWDGSTWVSIQIGPDPFAGLAFCGGYVGNGWYGPSNQVWATSSFPELILPYDTSAAVDQNGVPVF